MPDRILRTVDYLEFSDSIDRKLVDGELTHDEACREHDKELEERWGRHEIDDDRVLVSFPARWEICHRCRGEGTHDHPAFSDGFTGSEWADMCHDDPDWPEDYMRGVYDVACEECHGSGKVLEVDRKAAEREGLSKHLAAAESWANEKAAADAAYAAEIAVERRMGC